VWEKCEEKRERSARPRLSLRRKLKPSLITRCTAIIVTTAMLGMDSTDTVHTMATIWDTMDTIWDTTEAILVDTTEGILVDTTEDTTDMVDAGMAMAVLFPAPKYISNFLILLNQAAEFFLNNNFLSRQNSFKIFHSKFFFTDDNKLLRFASKMCCTCTSYREVVPDKEFPVDLFGSGFVKP
jgi:hypothetical protein